MRKLEALSARNPSEPVIQVLQTADDIRDARSKNGFRMEQSLWASKADYTFLTISAPLES